MRRLFLAVPALAALLLLAPAVLSAQGGGRTGLGELAVSADDPGQAPDELRGVGFEQHLGAELPLGLSFRDEHGTPVELGDYFGERPVLLSLVYFDCPMLCPMTLNGLASSLKPLEWNPGREYEVVVVSFDPAEGPELAAEAKRRTLVRYGRSGIEDGFHFLTGDAEAVRRLADAVGFRYSYDEEREEWAHAAGLVMTTPSGTISRYYFGIEYVAKDLKLGLVESGQGEIGSVVDQLLLYCFHYDPQLGRYEWSERALLIMRIGGLLTILALGSFIIVMVRRERRLAQTPRTA
jgi:protein SCO1